MTPEEHAELPAAESASPDTPGSGVFRVRALGGFGQPPAELGTYDGRVDRIAFWIAVRNCGCGQILSFEDPACSPGRALRVPDGWNWRVAKDETVRVRIAGIEHAGLPAAEKLLAYQAAFPEKDVEVRQGKHDGYVLLRKR